MIRKICGFIAGIPVLFADANAIKVNEYSITLTDDLKLDKMYKQDEYRAMASEILRQHYNAHLAKVRMENKSELAKWDNETYNESVYGVILNEIARCFFNINNDMVTYNKFDGRMIECIGTDPLKYDAANWNYVFLINFIDRFMANTVEYISTNAFKKLFDQALEETKGAILNAKKEDGYMCDYATYKDAIERAYSDIKEYCAQLQLSDYLIELMRARLIAAKIKYKWIIKKDKEGNEVQDGLDYEDAKRQHKDYITKIDKSPKDEHGEHIDEFMDNDWIQMTLELGGVTWLPNQNQVYSKTQKDTILMDASNEEEYQKRIEEHIYIEQPQEDLIFKKYTIVFGKITQIGSSPSKIRDVRYPKYQKISDNTWHFDNSVNPYLNSEYTYEGYVPHETMFVLPNYYNLSYKANKDITDRGDKMIDQRDQEELNKLKNYDMESERYTISKARYVYRTPYADFRAYIRLLYNIPWVERYNRIIGHDWRTIYFNEHQGKPKDAIIPELKSELAKQIQNYKEIINTAPTEANIKRLREMENNLELIDAIDELTNATEENNVERGEQIQKYKQYEAIMSVKTDLKSLVNEFNNIDKQALIKDDTQGEQIYKQVKAYTDKISKKVRLLTTATNMLPTEDTINKAKQIIIDILQLNTLNINQDKPMEDFIKKLNGKYTIEDEATLTRDNLLDTRTYFTRIKECIETQLGKLADNETVYTCLRRARRGFSTTKPSLYKEIEKQLLENTTQEENKVQ